MIKRKAILNLAFATCVAAAFSTTAASAIEMRLQTSESRILTMATQPGTIIVSNPEFVSVSVLSSKRLLVQGLNTGFSNVLVMDKKGNRLASLEVSVSSRYSRRELRSYVAGERATYTCNPDCARVVSADDGIREMAETLSKHRRYNSMRDLYLPSGTKQRSFGFFFGF